jgi:hypothetical protein
MTGTWWAMSGGGFRLTGANLPIGAENPCRSKGGRGALAGGTAGGRVRIGGGQPIRVAQRRVARLVAQSPFER